MTNQQWTERAGFLLEAHSVVRFTAAEICPVGKVEKRAILEAPDPPLLLNALELIFVLMWARAREGDAAIAVNSWYRSTAYNRAAGGGKTSIHLLAGAADITKKGWTPRRLAMALHLAHPYSRKLGIGLYDDFVHVDVRGLLGRRAPARWPKKGPLAHWWRVGALS